jgi:hypothetical protein
MPRKKPTNKEEILEDIATHPERGKIDGEDVVRFSSVNMQVSIPAEMHSQLLEVAGALGIESKTEIVRHAIASFLSQPGTVAMVDRWQARKAEKHNTSKFQIKSKCLGAYKRLARERSARLGS